MAYPSSPPALDAYTGGLYATKVGVPFAWKEFGIAPDSFLFYGAALFLGIPIYVFFCKNVSTLQPTLHYC